MKLDRSNTQPEIQPQPPQPQLQDNAIILNLNTADVLAAKENVDDEGIIHVPDRLWDHIIDSVQHPEQSFYNELYINVNGIEPVIEQTDILGVRYKNNDVPWSDFTKNESGYLSINITSQCILWVQKLSGPNLYRFKFTVNETNTQTNVTIDGPSIYYIFNYENTDTLRFIDNNNNIFMVIEESTTNNTSIPTEISISQTAITLNNAPF